MKFNVKSRVIGTAFPLGTWRVIQASTQHAACDRARKKGYEIVAVKRT